MDLLDYDATSSTAEDYDRPPNFEDIDPKLMTTGELMDLRHRYTKAILQIRYHLDVYTTQLDQGQRQPDEHWAGRAEHSLQCRRIDRDRLDVVLAKRTKNPGMLYSAFVDAAREHLDDETYADLFDVARDNLQPYE